MDNVSQVILRQAGRLPGGAVALLNPPPDELFRELAPDGRMVRVSCTSRGEFRRLQAMGADAHFEAVPVSLASPAAAILVLPREKDRLAMLLHAVSRQLDPAGRLWLAGPNRAGIKSSPRVLKRFFNRVEKLDAARHCALFEASGPLQVAAFDLDNYEIRWSLEHAGVERELVSLPGVFAHGRLDRGTALLLDVLAGLKPGGRVLDFASGCGVVAVFVKAMRPESDLVLLDDSALAIEAGVRSLRLNELDAESVASDGLSELQGRFDWILSNPPFHRGVGNDFDIAARFFREAGTFLSENGKMVVVFNRHLPYVGWLRESFKRVDCLAQNREFTVIQASENI